MSFPFRRRRIDGDEKQPRRRQPGLLGRRPRRPLGLRGVIVLTAPVLFAIVYLLAGAVRDYQNLSRFDDWWASGRQIDELFVQRARLALRSPVATTIRQRLEPGAPDPAVVRLRVQKDVWNNLERDVQGTWGVWIDAELMRGNVAEQVQLRRRGDTSVHWTTGKLSFTLETERSSLFKGFRTLGFSAADVLPSYVAGALTHEFGLLAPNTSVVPVFVNDRFYGLYQVNEIVDESLLRRHGHMPGNIFRGDAAERGDTYKGVPRGLFNNANIWELVAVNDRPAAPRESALVEFLRDINGDTFDDHLRLMSRLDRDEIARFLACMLVVGDLYHIDNLHNQFWFEDPWSGRLHPIVWDLRILDLANPPLWVNELLRALLRDPFLVESILHEVQRQLEDDRILTKAEQLARVTYERFRPHFEYEHLRQGVISDVGEPEQVVQLLHGNARLLREWLADARLAMNAALPAAGPAILDFESRGYTGADLVALQVHGTGDMTGLRIRADRNGNGRPDAEDPLLPLRAVPSESGLRLELAVPASLMAGWDTRGRGVRPGAVHYRFFLEGEAVRDGRVREVRPEARNRLTGEVAEVLDWEPGAARTPSHSWSPWQYPTPAGRTWRWAGLVEIRDTFRIAAADTLLIAPGTTVRLGAEASIVARGLVRAEGNADSPVTFVPAIAAQPWGTLALQGAGADSSLFQHVRFTGGGGAVLDRIEYSGMVSVHWARGVVFDNAAFGPNLRSDDTFHAMHADVTLRDCSFEGANSDAVDYDYSTGEISGCRFDGSGNDAIDLMTSSPLIIGNRITGSGDKGISVGEDSHPLIFNNHIANSTRGIEVKDRSGPLLVHNVITGNGIGVLQNVKNWRYGSGGWAKLVNTVVEGNQTDFEADTESRLTAVMTPATAARSPSLALTPGVEEALPSAPIDASWVLAQFGIRTEPSQAGLVAEWQRVEPVAPIVAADFEDDFDSLADGWQPRGGASRLEKRRQALVASLEPGQGGMARSVDWDLSDGAVLVLEVATRDAESVNVVVTGARETVTRAVQAGTGQGIFRFVVLELPPDHYTSVEIGAVARRGTWEVDARTGFVDTRKARLELGSYLLVRRASAASPSPVVVGVTDGTARDENTGGDDAPPRR